MNDVQKPLIEKQLRDQATARMVKLTVHAHQEMVEEAISAKELLVSLQQCVLVENYPDHKRGPCCLACGKADTGRYLHVVCTTGAPELIVITVYEPKPPKWQTPFMRGTRQ